jgi:hypothetical protein
LIESIGIHNFYNNTNYEYLYDKELPKCFEYIFSVFCELFNCCTTLMGFCSSRREITWQDINAYCNVRNIRLKQIEIDYLLKIKSWASESINELEKDI